ncbi:MAG TPA: metallophosphoesterase [Pyrinomonadaceae bacterium]|nr:metallophosphoesterase [Pyrinomonadaceae bacterium]
MPEEASPPLDLDPWFEGPEAEEYTVTVNVLAWLLMPLLGSLIFWGGLWLINVAFHPVNVPYVGGLLRVAAGIYGPVSVAIFFLLLYIILDKYQLNRLSSRIRGFVFGALPERQSALRFHAVVCAALASAVILLAVPLSGFGAGFAAVAADWHRPRELAASAFASLYAGSWLRLFNFAYFSILLMWLVMEVYFALSFEAGKAKVERVERFDAPADASPVARVAHLTDLHVTATDDTARVDGGAGGNAPLRRALDELGRRSDDELSAILITGDATDAGTAGEWQRFFDIFPSELLAKSVLVPGNHEVNIPQGKGLRAAVEPQDQIERKVRAVRFIAAADRVQGARSFVADPKTPDGPLLPLRHYLAGHREGLELFIGTARRGKTARNGREWKKVSELPYTVWDEIFPMVVELPGTELRVVVLNSNDEGLDYLTNAYGLIGRRQIARLRHVLRRLAGRPYVIAMHHHLGVVSFGKTFKERVFERAMAVIDGGALVKALAESHEGAGCVVFNGHRHVAYFARIGERIQIVSGPSTTLGDESGRRPAGEPGFGVYELGWDARAGTRCVAERWCGLA